MALQNCLESISSVELDTPKSLDVTEGIPVIHATFQSTMIGFIDDTWMSTIAEQTTGTEIQL